MNSTTRTATRGGNKSKDKSHKSENKKDPTKAGDAVKGHLPDRASHNSDSTTEEIIIAGKVDQVMAIVQVRTEAEVVAALHDSDYDVLAAVTSLLDDRGQGEWETSGKKKKNRQASASKGVETTGSRGEGDGAEDGETQPLAANMDRDRSRGRGGSANRSRRRGTNDGRGPGRGRDNNKENEGGGEDGFRGGFRRGGRGMSNGPGSRGGRGGRGGSRLGSRTFQNRDKSVGDRFPSTIDTWNPAGSQETGEKGLKMETWTGDFPPAEDWDNEEYTGSLADSKVFTPSALETSVAGAEQIPAAPNQDLLTMSSSTAQDFHQASAMPSSPLPVAVGALSTAQAQYLNQLTQQSNENLKARAGATAASTNAYQTESLKTAVGIGSTGSYSQPTGYGQNDAYGQSNFSQSTYGQSTGTGYGGPTGSFQGSSGFATSNSASFANSAQNYQTSGTSSFGVYPSPGGSTQGYSTSNVTYDNSNAQSETNGATSAQPPRTKPQRARVPPPSKIPSSAVEMPEDPITASMSSLGVQFGGLEFGSDASAFEPSSSETNKFQQQTPTSTTVTTDVSSAGSTSVALDNTSSQSSALDAYPGSQNAATVKSSQQTSLVSSLSGKGLPNSEGLNMQSSTDHKNNYNAQPARVSSSTSGLDLSGKADVSGGLSYPTAPASASYGGYQSQKGSSSVYQTTNYPSNNAFTTQQTTYSTATYNNQPAANSSFPNSSYSSQPSNSTPVNYSATGGVYPSSNSFQNASQSYQSGPASVYGSALGSGYSASAGSGYTNYSSGSSTSAKLNSSLVTTKESQEYSAASTTSSISSTTNSTPSLGLTTTPQTVTTSSTKVSAGQIKSSVVPSIHPQMMGAPQYIVGSAGVPFYQTQVYGFDDVLMHQRIPHMSGYYDISGYSAAPTSIAGVTARDSLANVAYTMADARYSTRGDNNASPVPSTLSQQTATAAHQQPMINHPTLPPGYTYVYGAVPGSFHQYSTPIYPVPSAGNTHGTSSNQYGKPASYTSTYGSGYDGLNQTTEYGKSAYVSAAGNAAKSGVGAVTVSSATTASDLYNKAHTALGKVNSYDKQGFHSATPPPFNLAGGQSTGLAPSGAYAPQLFIPAMPPHQQHHGTALIQSHLQDSGSSSGQRTQSAAQPSKSGNKQNYNYWPPN